MLLFFWPAQTEEAEGFRAACCFPLVEALPKLAALADYKLLEGVESVLACLRVVDVVDEGVNAPLVSNLEDFCPLVGEVLAEVFTLWRAPVRF